MSNIQTQTVETKTKLGLTAVQRSHCILTSKRLALQSTTLIRPLATYYASFSKIIRTFAQPPFCKNKSHVSIELKPKPKMTLCDYYFLFYKRN